MYDENSKTLSREKKKTWTNTYAFDILGMENLTS